MVLFCYLEATIILRLQLIDTFTGENIAFSHLILSDFSPNPFGDSVVSPVNLQCDQRTLYGAAILAFVKGCPNITGRGWIRV